MVIRSFTTYILAFGALALPVALMSGDDADNNATPPATKEAPAPKKVPTKEELHSQAYIDKLSETYGHLIQKSLNNPVVKLNPKAVMKGMQDGMDGKAAPLTEKEYEEALNHMQKYAYEDMANKNLAEAEAMLKKNASEDGVVSLEEGKVQYKVLKPGTGELVVTEETVPTINYEATYSNGQKLGSSEQQGGPIEVKLNDTIPGFKKGMMGMKVGEKRKIWIHPDMGFGKNGQLPNGLLIFEIEVTKISPKSEESDDSDEDDEDDDDDLSALVNTEDLLADDEDDDDDDDVEDDIDYDRATFDDDGDDDQDDQPAKK